MNTLAHIIWTPNHFNFWISSPIIIILNWAHMSHNNYSIKLSPHHTKRIKRHVSSIKKIFNWLSILLHPLSYIVIELGLGIFKELGDLADKNQVFFFGSLLLFTFFNSLYKLEIIFWTKSEWFFLPTTNSTFIFQLWFLVAKKQKIWDHIFYEGTVFSFDFINNIVYRVCIYMAMTSLT